MLRYLATFKHCGLKYGCDFSLVLCREVVRPNLKFPNAVTNPLKSLAEHPIRFTPPNGHFKCVSKILAHLKGLVIF